MLAAAPGQLPSGQVWVTAWAGSVHGPYPSGNPVAQPVLDRVFDAQRGATDQTFRLIVRPASVGTAGAPALRQHLRHTTGHARRSLRRPPGGRRHDRRGNESARQLQRQVRRHTAPWPISLQRPRGAALRRTRRANRPRRPQARRQLPRRGIDGTDDVARQGAADLVCQRARQRQPRGGGIRCGVAVHDHVLVLPRCDRRPGSAGHLDGRLLRRFDHRRHRLDVERRRSLARRVRAPPPRRLRPALRRRQRRHRRQPHHQSDAVRPEDALRRRTIGTRPPRTRRAVPLRRLDDYLARRASTTCRRAPAPRRSSRG